jgi:glycosyltransferase involved in cell wall biosynthesis
MTPEVRARPLALTRPSPEPRRSRPAAPAAALPLVSVIIPVYNRAHTLPATLQSVQAQTWRPLEIVAIDDGSTDDSLALLRDFAAASDIPLQLRTRGNRGVTASRNEGLGLARGEFIAFVDSDDLWSPDKIERQMGLLSARPEIGLCHTGVEQIDEHARPLQRYLDPDPACRGRWLLAQIESNHIQTSSVLMRREVFESTGRFDESLRACEDWDYWIRVASRHGIEFLPEHLTQMRQHAVRLSRDVELMRTSHFAVLDKLDRHPAMGDPALRAAVDLRRRRTHFEYGRSRITYLLDMRGGRADLRAAGWIPGQRLRTLGLWLRSVLPMRQLRAARVQVQGLSGLPVRTLHRLLGSPRA